MQIIDYYKLYYSALRAWDLLEWNICEAFALHAVKQQFNILNMLILNEAAAV